VVACTIADGVAVGRRVGVAVAVALAVVVVVTVDVALSVAELLPVPLVDGEGVRDAPPEAVLVALTWGLGVVEEVGVPPLLQAATAIARTAAPAAARPTRSSAGVAAGRVAPGGVSAGAVPCARIGSGRVATGTVRRTFMKPPRMTDGQWRGSTHLSMCHPNRQ
jgi:hypothetical protein